MCSAFFTFSDQQVLDIAYSFYSSVVFDSVTEEKNESSYPFLCILELKVCDGSLRAEGAS